MPFRNGKVTFQRFKVLGDKPRAFDMEHIDRLADHMAGRQKIASADGIETGWAAGKHILDKDFSLEKNVYPDHLLCDFWTQADKLPSDKLKAYYEVELAALIVNNPSGFPSARQKREAKEAARERLEQEARDGRYLKAKLAPFCWDAVTNTVFMGTTSAAAIDRFMSLFEQTFGVGLEIITAGSLAASIHTEKINTYPSRFVPGVSPEDGPYWCPDRETFDFLGNEFLTWLWYFGANESDTLELPDASQAAFMLSGGVKLDCPRGQSGNDTCNHEGPARMPEALRALRTGKLPRKAGLTLVRHNEQFTLHLQAERFTVSSAKLPELPDDVSGERAVIEWRLQRIRDLVETIDLMYATFLGLRLSRDWSIVHHGNMQRWIAGEEVTA